MHELAITQGVVDAVTERIGTAPVAAVRVRVGRLAGVVPDAMAFCFELVTAGTPLEGAVLEFDQTGHDDGAQTVDIEASLLAKNDHLAGHNRAWLAERGIVALNLMSSPGSGKTSLLRRTIAELAPVRPVSVVEGDQETRIDAEKIRATGAPVVQINTGSGCHLDAGMLARGLAELAPPPGSLVVSVTEGEDKPLKYPYMFSVADVVVINKIDLLPVLTPRGGYG